MFLATCWFLSSCSEEKDPISKTMYYPVLKMKSDTIVAVVKGASIPAADITALEGEKATEIFISPKDNEIRNDTIFLQYQGYNAKNEYGYYSREPLRRIVCVLESTPQQGIDLSGRYAFNDPSFKWIFTNISKTMANGVFVSSNSDAGQALKSGYIYSVDGINVAIPKQTALPLGGKGTVANDKITLQLIRIDAAGNISTRDIVWTKYVEATELKADKDSLRLKKKEKVRVTITVLPENATIQEMEWKSSDMDVARPNKVSTMVYDITGRNNGKAEIVISSIYWKAKKVIYVEVTD